MKRHRRGEIWLAAFIAIVLSFSTIGQARVISELCAKGDCGSECGMHAAKPVETPRSCCKSQVEQDLNPPEKAGCKCEIRSVPDATVGASLTFILLTPMPFIIQEGPDVARDVCTVPRPLSIIFAGDSSPPEVSYHPDFGRAPPVV